MNDFSLCVIKLDQVCLVSLLLGCFPKAYWGGNYDRKIIYLVHIDCMLGSTSCLDICRWRVVDDVSVTQTEKIPTWMFLKSRRVITWAKWLALTDCINLQSRLKRNQLQPHSILFIFLIIVDAFVIGSTIVEKSHLNV